MWLDWFKESYPTKPGYFLVPRFTLRVIAFYPEPNKSLWLHIWAFLNFLMLSYGCYAEFYYGVHFLSIDVVIALDALCPVASSLLSLLKMCCIWWYRVELQRLIQRVGEMAELDGTPKKLQIKRQWYAYATRLSALVLWLGFWTASAYTLRSLLMNAWRVVQGRDFVFETPFKMIFPERLLAMPYYPFTFLFSHWHGYITVACFAGGDSLFLSFCLYFTTLLKMLQQDLLQVVKKKPNEITEERLCAELAKIIDRHNEISQLVQDFSVAMVGITLGHFVTSSIIIGTSIIDMLLFSGYGIMVYVVYTSCVVVELFLYCLGGTAVIESSEQLATIAYSSEWYMHGLRVQKMILLVMIRAQRGLVVKVPFFAPSLPALTSILRFTGSLIAVAKSII